MTYETASGRRIELSPRSLGRGGEGEVLAVANAPGLAAKIYHHPSFEHRSKLEFMVANPVPQARDHFWVTWPIETIYTKGFNPKFAGYIMPKLTQAQPIFTCYSPAVRQQKCPDFNYRHLVRCARNLAAAFRLAHSHRHVIGDANESNVFASNDARVTLIDSDSWQIIDAVGGRTYRSPVAKSDFLPPELQNRSLKNLVRQPWHDNFALAVLLFKLTGEGNHPFDGVYLGGGDVPELASRIATGAFPYRDGTGRWIPKGLALPFDTLHHRLQKLFIQAFEGGYVRPQSRPDASAWLGAITLAERELQGCHQNTNHWFWGNHCIWCQRKTLLDGLDPFPGGRPVVRRSTATAAPAVPIPVRVVRPAAKTVAVPASSQIFSSSTIGFLNALGAELLRPVVFTKRILMRANARLRALASSIFK